MRLLVVSQYFWPENFRINDLVAALVARGHEVTVLTGKPNYPSGTVDADFAREPERFSTYAGCRVVRVPMLARGRGNIRLLLNYLSFAVSASLLGPIRMRGAAFDAIFVFQASPVTVGIPAAVLRRIKRAPMAMWILDLWPESLSAVGVLKPGRAMDMVGALVRWIYHRCDLILVQSRQFMQPVLDNLCQPVPVRYFPSWSDNAGAPEDAEPAPEVGPDANRFTVMFAGNIGEAQDFPAILDAAELLRAEPVRWMIVGDGRKADWVREEIARRGLSESAFLLGRHPLERMPSFYRSADALLASLKHDPVMAMTIPGKVQSYMAAGIPILAMLDGEGGDAVAASEAGYVAPSGDAGALAEAVRRLAATSAEERRDMGRRGRDYAAEHFDRETLIGRLEAWLNEIKR